jgi:hypothetical protein
VHDPAAASNLQYGTKWLKTMSCLLQESERQSLLETELQNGGPGRRPQVYFGRHTVDCSALCLGLLQLPRLPGGAPAAGWGLGRRGAVSVSRTNITIHY